MNIINKLTADDEERSSRYRTLKETYKIDKSFRKRGRSSHFNLESSSEILNAAHEIVDKLRQLIRVGNNKDTEPTLNKVQLICNEVDEKLFFHDNK